jgi:hypothetical protein
MYPAAYHHQPVSLCMGRRGHRHVAVLCGRGMAGMESTSEVSRLVQSSLEGDPAARNEPVRHSFRDGRDPELPAERRGRRMSARHSGCGSSSICGLARARWPAMRIARTTLASEDRGGGRRYELVLVDR